MSQFTETSLLRLTLPRVMEDEYEMQEQFEDAFSNVGQGLDAEHKTAMLEYWQRAIDDIEQISEDGNDQDVFKSTVLPLARIKKVMKTDSEVRMISAEAPILFAKGCEIFITELTMRAWIHAEENKRRTLQRSDIATALQKSDVFDFLIDLVPREEAQPRRPMNPPRHFPPNQRFDMDHQIVVNGPETKPELTNQLPSMYAPPDGVAFDPRQFQPPQAMGLNALSNAARMPVFDMGMQVPVAFPFPINQMPAEQQQQIMQQYLAQQSATQQPQSSASTEPASQAPETEKEANAETPKKEEGASEVKEEQTDPEAKK